MTCILKNIITWINPTKRKTEDMDESFSEKDAATLHGSSNTTTNGIEKLCRPYTAYVDQHHYCRIDTVHRKRIKPIALQTFPLKKVYSCFLWQLYINDTIRLTKLIDNNPQLELIEHQSMIEAASKADILILTSGSGIYHIDSFLGELDTSAKVIIIASIRELNSVQLDIKHRIDFHIHKMNLFEQPEFDQFIEHVLNNTRDTA